MEHIYKELQKPIQNTLEIYKQLYKHNTNNYTQLYKTQYKYIHTTITKIQTKNNGTYIQRTIDNYTKHYRNIQKPIQT